MAAKDVDRFNHLTVRIYESTCLSYASVRNKQAIGVERRANAVANRDLYDPGTPEYLDWDQQQIRWTSLLSLFARYLKYLTTKGSDFGGMIPYGAELIDLCGWSAEISPLSAYENIQMSNPLCFDSQPVAAVTNLQTTWTPDDTVQRTPTTPWTDQYITIFDSFMYDVYMCVSCGVWFDNEVNLIRTDLYDDLTRDWDYILAIWDMLIGSSLAYLHFGRACLAKEDLIMREILDPGQETEKSMFIRKADYFGTDSNDMTVIDGLWQINYDDLNPAWQANVSPSPLVFEEVIP